MCGTANSQQREFIQDPPNPINDIIITNNDNDSYIDYASTHLPF